MIEAIDLEVNESALTGGSMSVEKDHESTLDINIPVSERRNIVFLGTYIVRDRGKGVIVATE